MSAEERAEWETRARLHALQFDRGAVLDAILDRVARVHRVPAAVG